MGFGDNILPAIERQLCLIYSCTIAFFSQVGMPFFRLIQRQHTPPEKAGVRQGASLYLPKWTVYKVLVCVLCASILHILSGASFSRGRKKERRANTLIPIDNQSAGLLASTISQNQEALLRQLNPETVEALAGFLTSIAQQEPTRRSIVLATLEILRKSTLLDVPKQILDDDNMSIEALKKFGDHALGKLALALIGALSDDEWIVRATTVRALGELGEYVPLNLLAIILKSDEDYLVRTAAAHAIGRIKKRASLELLISALSDCEWSVREMAVLMLGEFKNLAPLGPIVKALDDEDGSVREAAVRALGQLGEQAPIEPLLRALRDEEESIREAATQVLWKLGRRTQEELLIAAFLDEDGLIAIAVDKVIGEAGEFTLAKLLESALTGGERASSETPLLSLLQELLARDLIKRNEIKSPLWQWCMPVSGNFPDEADQRGTPVKQQESGTINLFRLRNQLLQDRRDWKDKGEMIEQNIPKHLRDSSPTSYPNASRHHRPRFKRET